MSWHKAGSEVRHRLGLPVPLGFGDAASRLGLDPAPPPGAVGDDGWDVEQLRSLVARAHLWCVATADGRLPALRIDL